MDPQQAKDPARDQVIQRIRESLNWLRRTPVGSTTPYQKTERDIRDAIRQLSRQRVSDLLRQLRAAHGLSYEQIHDQTGLSQQLLFDVEFKDRRLSLDELHRLAACYQVSIDDLLGVDIDWEP
jgi:hypothetical protein